MGSDTGNAMGPARSVTSSELAPLLSPWEDKRWRRTEGAVPQEAAAGGRVASGRAASGADALAFHFADAPPHRVRDALGLVAGRSLPNGPGQEADRSTGRPSHQQLTELALSHWGRLSGEVGFEPDRIQVDEITAPVAKAAGIDRWIREARPDSLARARVSTWSAWMAREPLQQCSGERFADLDLFEVAVVSWRWA